MAMKSSDEIKKALNCCSNVDGLDGDCAKCPYKGVQWCGDKSKIDALAYIQQLENQIGELTEKVMRFEAEQPKISEIINRDAKVSNWRYNDAELVRREYSTAR